MPRLRFNFKNPQERPDVNTFRELMADPRIAVKLSVIRTSAEIFEHILDTMDKILPATERLYLGKAVINLIADMVINVDAVYRETISILEAVWKVADENMDKYVPGTREQVQNNVKDVDEFLGNVKTFINGAVKKLGASSLNKKDLVEAMERNNPLKEFGELLK